MTGLAALRTFPGGRAARTAARPQRHRAARRTTVNTMHRLAALLRRGRDARAAAISTERLEEFRDHAAGLGLDASREHYEYMLAARRRGRRSADAGEDENGRRLAAIREVLIGFDWVNGWESGDYRRALEEIERIAFKGLP